MCAALLLIVGHVRERVWGLLEQSICVKHTTPLFMIYYKRCSELRINVFVLLPSSIFVPLRRTDIFVFLLSTRAGGLGINLTAADTVSH